MLIALGLKAETADMCYNLYFASSPLEINNYGADLYKDPKYIPSWSLARLLDLMPKSLQINRPKADLDINSDGMYWFITYEELGYYVVHQEMKRNLFDAVISMIRWLIENRQINKEYLQ